MIKIKSRLKILAIFLLLNSINIYADTNLTSNAGFELSTNSGCPAGITSCPSDWNWTGGADYTGLSLNPHEGTNSFRFGAVYSNSPTQLSQSLSTVSGATYSVTFYLSNPYFSIPSPNSSGYSNNFNIKVNGLTLINLNNITIPTFSLYNSSFTASSNSSALMFSAYDWSASGGFFLDDIFVTRIGPGTADTQASMTTNAHALRGAYSLQSAIINTGLSYDCTTFDKNGICVSAGGRVTDTNNPSTNSQGALLIASYRANEQWRVGAYLDQNLSSNDARGVNLDNNNPMGGVFAVWNQNTDGTGYQVRLASGYSDKDVTISRSAFGATGEAGKGDSSLQSQAYSATLSRGFQLNNTRWVASPYLGVRYTKIKRAGYTEDNSADVTAPLTYSALSQETTTALVGVRFNGQLGDKINLMASAGIENDIAHNTGDYAATGVDGLTPVAFNQNIRHIRPVASAGASYAIDKRQTVGANLNFRQEAFNSTNSVSGMVTYQVGF